MMTKRDDATGEIRLEILNDLDELDRLNAAIEALGVRWDLLPQAIAALQIALEEVVSNIIRHGFRDDERHRVLVRIARRAGGALRIEVEDDGAPFDPLAAPHPPACESLEACEPGGLGIHLVRHLMDEVSYQRSGANNVLSMTKKGALR